MTKKVAYIFAFMLLLDLLASCSKTNTFQVKLNAGFMNLRDYVANKTLVEDDAVKATNLEANMQYEFVQFASHFQVPSLFSNTAYAADENNWIFQNNFENIVVFAKTKAGPDRNITSDCNFIFKGVSYTAEELIVRLNAHLQSFQPSETSPSIGIKVRFSSNLARTESQLIKINTILTDINILPNSIYLDIN